MINLEKYLNDWITTQNPNSCVDILKSAEKLIEKYNELDKALWFNFLNSTYKPQFLQALENEENRIKWANLVFKILQKTNYNFRDMLEARVKEHPKRILFQDMSSSIPSKWTYEQIFRHVKEVATVFYNSVKEEPRVAIFSQNHIESAVSDLACLTFNIFDTPLNIHFNEETVKYIIELLKINIIIVDTKQRISIIENIKKEINHELKIFTIFPESAVPNKIELLQESCKKLNTKEIDETIQKIKPQKTNKVATTMFTSGSTGQPKGVSFSIYNLVSKRFGRGAALPKIGDGEVMICYLPLFHTFGRFLELMGTIYWNGTYVFVGNSSKETLLKLFPEINPSIFISIPVRWQELYEACLEATANISDDDFAHAEVRKTVGINLKWGLSAAGYLDPKVFRYFQNQGIELCSGFGMTEASGGITMTPPGDYSDDSVGKPLPGVITKLNENQELLLSGHYIAKYLELAGINDVIDYPVSPDKDYWMSTGDIFIIQENGHHQIVDRVKDIYKNNKGQTVAPRNVEKKFIGVPGIKNTFLIGDGKPYNVLLIVPDYEDTILNSSPKEYHDEYFHQIVMQANKDIAPYERVVNFTIIDRDFSIDKGELTAKGSFNRKQIEKNFVNLIENLYSSNNIVLKAENFEITIPRWFFRDLGILENDLYYSENKLINKNSKKSLIIKKNNLNSYRIGDYIYTIKNDNIELGLLTRQPKLWLGNIQLIEFCPVMEGWDIPINNIKEHLDIIENEQIIYEPVDIKIIKGLKDNRLNEINKLLVLALFSPVEIAEKSIIEIGNIINKYDNRISNLIRRRLETLANSNHENIRTLAYRILLLDDPNPDYNISFPAFIKSGKTFLNQESINFIAKSNIGKQHLQALRQRLHLYRSKVNFEYDETTVIQFEKVLSLLYIFASKNFEYYSTVRAEFSSWILNSSSKQLAKAARYYFDLLAIDFDNYVEKKLNKYHTDFWKNLITFSGDISPKDQNRLITLFESSFYLQKSVIITFNDFDFNMQLVAEKGIWIIKLLALKNFTHYRISINTSLGKHYDLHLVLSENLSTKTNVETFLLMASVSGYPLGATVLPALGYSWSDMGVLTTQYIGGLTAWDKIREYSDIHKSAGNLKKNNAWKKLYIKALSTFFKGWKYTGFKIIPGVISTANVVVPELDFRENAIIISASGWKNVSKVSDIVKEMLHDFYFKVIALYPWSKPHLNANWIFDACIEALGEKEAFEILQKLKIELENETILCPDKISFTDKLENYIKNYKSSCYLPLSLYNAIDQYNEWEKMNTYSTAEAKEQTIFELIELYKLHKYPEIVRYELYRKTYFEDANQEIKDNFDKLIEKMNSEPKVVPLQFIELSDLQASIEDIEDKKVFSKMVFPTILSKQKLDIMKIGEKRIEHVIINSEIVDKNGVKYNFREPIEPSEVGFLYQLFYKENYPKEISDMDKHLVMTDKNNLIIGGLSYKNLENNTVLLDGIVINSALQGKGLGAAMIDDFFTRMSSEGIKVVKAHFLFGNYYLKHNFKVDKNWGALVKFL